MAKEKLDGEVEAVAIWWNVVGKEVKVVGDFCQCGSSYSWEGLDLQEGRGKEEVEVREGSVGDVEGKILVVGGGRRWRGEWGRGGKGGGCGNWKLGGGLGRGEGAW